jgi:hypothetical protein
MSTGSDGGYDFDALLERELRRRVGTLQGPSPGLDRAAYRAVAAPRSPLTASASWKAAVGLATAALIVGGGTAAAATGSANPVAWGKTVTDAVATCTSQLTNGRHGIGQCVSVRAGEKGREQRSAHDGGSGQRTAPAGTPSPHPSGRPTPHPTGAPTDHPAGRPTGVPVGPPASLPPAAEGAHPTSPPVVPPTPHPPTPPQ